MKWPIIMLLSLTGSQCFPILCDASGNDAEIPRNRVDFTSVYFDTINTDQFTGILGYTRNLSSSSNLSVRMAYLDSRFGVSGGSGLGDTTVTYSYLPNEQMSVGPWIPRIVGTGVSVTFPTGNEHQGRGLGSAVLTPFVGTRLSLSDSISFTPTLAYAFSVDPLVTGSDVRIALLDLGLTWVGENGWWASIYVGYVKDYEAGSTTDGARFSTGKVFANGLGFSAHFINRESFRPGLIPPQAHQYDQVYEVTLLYGF